MFGLLKTKVKVYFYHLFILALVMLCCFFLMYKDIKRIEGNVLNLRTKCNQLETQLLTNDCPLNVDYNGGVDNVTDVVDNVDNVTDVVDNGDNVTDVVDNVTDVVDNGDVDDVVDNGDVDDDLNLLKKITLQNDNDEINDLLNEVENIQSIPNEDLSKLSKNQLLFKTKNELKEYLKSVGKSTSGNKKELIEIILN